LSAAERAILNNNGYDDALIASTQKAVNQKHNKATYIAPRGGGNNNSKYTKAQADAALASALAGNTDDPHVRSIIEGYFGMPVESVLAGRQPEHGRGYDDVVDYVEKNFPDDPDAAWSYLERQYEKNAISGDDALYIFETVLGFNSDDYLPKVGTIGIVGVDLFK
jgi:hypothetical protein